MWGSSTPPSNQLARSNVSSALVSVVAPVLACYSVLAPLGLLPVQDHYWICHHTPNSAPIPALILRLRGFSYCSAPLSSLGQFPPLFSSAQPNKQPNPNTGDKEEGEGGVIVLPSKLEVGDLISHGLSHLSLSPLFYERS